MGEEFSFEFHSSQDNLPLSQESFQLLWDELNDLPAFHPIDRPNGEGSSTGTTSDISTVKIETKLENDLSNYMRFKLQGGKIFLKKGVLPHKFDCWKGAVSSSTMKKRERKALIKDTLDCYTSTSVVADATIISVEPETPSLEYHQEANISQNNENNFEVNIKKEELSFEFDKIPQSESNARMEISLEQVGVLASTIEVPQVQSHSLCTRVPSSLPASQNWPGEFEFTVSFGRQERNTKGVAWTYSEIKDKLYVGKDVPCPINFSANTVLPNDVTIRAMALYSSPEQICNIVHRCVNHSMDELEKGLVEAEHLVRCESRVASYKTDPVTQRHSIIVPFENPPVGQHFSTYIYKFACFGSCSGGPNRRPLMIIFTLERNNEVIGRRKLDVKICACPGRDRKTEEAQVSNSEIPIALKRKETFECAKLSDPLEFTKSLAYPPSKKSKVMTNKDGKYILAIDNLECYEFLKQMKKFFEIYKVMKHLPPDAKRALKHFYRKRNDEDS